MNVIGKVLIVLLGMNLVACNLALEEEQILEEKPAIVIENKPSTEPVEPPSPDPILRAMLIADILYAAKGAFDDNNLMLPEGDNAYDRYIEVLEIDPGNAVALDGVQEVFSRYIDLADLAMEQGQYDSAEDMLLRADSINPADIKVLSALSRLEQSRLIKINLYTLDAMALSEQGTDILVQLWGIGQAIRNDGGTFLITARNDEEGRWIYKIMREAVGGFRLRGDITLGNSPSIRVTIPNIPG